MEQIPLEENIALNDALLQEIPPPAEQARPGSKDDIVQKIMELNEKAQLGLTEGITKLRRRSKNQLNKLLASLMEQSVQKQIDEKLGLDENQCNNTLRGVAFLRMMHDTLINVGEKVAEPYLARYDYSIAGYSAFMKSGPMSDEVDNCLAEIAQECDVLQYVESPYARLGLLHISAIASTIKKKSINNINNYKNARKLERPNPHPTNPVRGSGNRPPEKWEKYNDDKSGRTVKV